MIIGYARTSTETQIAGFEAQLKELTEAGCEKIYKEQVSSVSERKEFQAAIDFVREGDTLIVTKLDRLARSVPQLLKTVEILQNKGVALRILNLGMDTTTPTGKLMLVILGAIGQFEREITLERQKEGIAKAKMEGKFKGRAPVPKAVVEEVVRIGALYSRKEIARLVKISEPTVYRILRAAKSSASP